MITLAEAVADELHNAGVDRVFGLPGGEVLFFMDALRKKGIVFTLCRHESYAGIMASVYGKLKRIPGVVLTTLGPGAANLMLPISNSLLDREPLLAISAQIPFSWPITHTHQRLPLLETYQHITKYSAQVDNFSAREKVRKALKICIEEPAGPAYLTLTAEDAIGESYELLPEENVRSKKTSSSNFRFNFHDEKATETLYNRIAQAERPLVIVGIGFKQEDSSKLRKWLNAWSLPVAVTPKVKGIVDEREDNFVGVIGGMAIDNLMVEMLKSSDLLIGFGLDPVEVDKTWHTDLPVVWVLDSPLALQIVPKKNSLFTHYSIILDNLINMNPPRQWFDPFADFKLKRRKEYSDCYKGGIDFSRKPIALVRSLAEVMPPETIVTTDVGAHKYIFGQFWPSCKPDTFFVSNGLSGMGYGLPAAIGAKLARPDSPVLAVVGDGSLSMNFGELETAQRLGVPLIVVVMADRTLSLIYLSQQAKNLPSYGVNFNPVDSVLLANSLGIEGIRVDSHDMMASHICNATKENRSLVVEVPIDTLGYQGLV